MRYWPSGKQNLERTLDRQLCGSLTRKNHEKTVEFVFVYAGDNFFPPQAPLLALYPPSSLHIRFSVRWNWTPIVDHRSGRRMEEHVLTTNFILDKSRGTGPPLWIISLDLSKAFDTVNWDTLWEALRRQNLSDQLIWILQCLYHDQTGVVCDGAGASRKFDILSGVRQRCVQSPRLFCGALELAMSEWRAANPLGGIDVGDDMVRLLDLRFADDVLIFANTKEEAQNLLDSLVRHLAAAGLMLNTSKTLALTTEAQPLSFIQVGDSHMIKVLGHTE